MTVRYYPVRLPEDMSSTPKVALVVTLLQEAGYVICEPREECGVHPGQPAACYLCL